MSLVTVLGRTLGRGGGEEQAWQSGSLPQLHPSAFKGTEGQFMKKGFPVHSQVKGFSIVVASLSIFNILTADLFAIHTAIHIQTVRYFWPRGLFWARLTLEDLRGAHI